MKAVLLIALILFHVPSLAQVFDYFHCFSLSKYYPLNINKSQEDTLITSDLTARLNSLDTNDVSALWKLRTIKDKRIYKLQRDTVKSFKYNIRKHEFTSVELFVYNAQSKIALYIDCTDYYFDKNQIPASATQFFYNDKGKLTDKLEYYQSHYSAPLNEHSSFDLKNFRLQSAINYSVKKTKRRVLVFSNECYGPENYRSHDTMVINDKGLIVKHNSYADNRALGCPMGYHVNDTWRYLYDKDSVTIFYTRMHCLYPGTNGECVRYAEPEIGSTMEKFGDLKFNYISNANLRNRSRRYDGYILN